MPSQEFVSSIAGRGSEAYCVKKHGFQQILLIKAIIKVVVKIVKEEIHAFGFFSEVTFHCFYTVFNLFQKAS